MSIINSKKRAQFEEAYGLNPGEYDSLTASEQRIVKKDYIKFIGSPSDIEHPRFINRDGKEITLLEWANLFEDVDYKIIKKTEVNGYVVSTVRLGMNHSLLLEPPTYYETMVFSQKNNGINFNDLYQERYEKEAQAIKGHKNIVKQVKEGTIPNSSN